MKRCGYNVSTNNIPKKDGKYELDLVLRSNRTFEEHPLGIFHPHADVQHIKKENIGLIEVIGLAVLPARLKEELQDIGKYLSDDDIDSVASHHQLWAKEIKQKHGTITNIDKTNNILQQELATKFARILEDAGVFKNKDAFMRFIRALNEEADRRIVFIMKKRVSL